MNADLIDSTDEDQFPLDPKTSHKQVHRVKPKETLSSNDKVEKRQTRRTYLIKKLAPTYVSAAENIVFLLFSQTLSPCALTSSGLIRRVCCTQFWEPFQFAYKCNESIFHIPTFLIHHIYKSQDTSMKFVGSFLDYSSAFILSHGLSYFTNCKHLIVKSTCQHGRDTLPTEPSIHEWQPKRPDRWLTTQACFSVPFPYRFSKYITDSLTSIPYRL